MCEGKTIKCHRHVLVLHSSHFSDLFKDQTNFPTAVAVVNMKYIHLKAMVDYMYFGKIKLQENSEEMKQIIKCAGDLGLTALVNFIDEYLKTYPKNKNQVNGGNLSCSDLNGDIDSASKRKRASDATARVTMDSFKKPKMTDSPLNQSTPLRDGSKSILKSNSVDAKSINSSDNSEILVNDKIDKKRKSDDDEADDEESKTKRAREKEEEEESKRKAKEEEAKKKLRHEEEERKRREEEESKRKAEEKQKLEAERRKKAEEEKRKAAEEAKRKAEEEEKVRIEEEKKRKEAEKKKEEEQAKKVEEEKNKKETTKCDESASTKSCAVCNKQYKDNIDHRKVLDGVQFEKKCIMANCSKPLKFRRSLIDHLLKEHKIDVCDG